MKSKFLFEGGIYLMGDIHSEFAPNNKISSYIPDFPKNSLLIQVGDFGLGFKYIIKEAHTLEKLNAKCIDNDVHIFAIRGNHDSPKRFKEYNWKTFSNIKFLEDYTFLKINNKDFLFVGGAISIDRILRIPGKSYWEDETFILKEDKIKKCDVLITHSGPKWIGPNDKKGLKGWIELEERAYGKGQSTLWEECQKEREGHNKLIKLCGCKLHFLGHFHTSQIAENEGCESRILDINEIYELKI